MRARIGIVVAALAAAGCLEESADSGNPGPAAGGGASSGGAVVATPPPPPPAPPPSPPAAPPAMAGPVSAANPMRNPVYANALSLWRNGDPAKHPKGSCASCHGADFFDLAAGGFDAATIRRRALIDGATEEEAATLNAAVDYLREAFRLPQEDGRSFRPFQPGGSVLRPELSGSTSLSSAAVTVERDIAFGEQWRRLVPSLAGRPVMTLAEAHRVRDEMLAINPRTLPVGFEYPLWSADRAFGEAFGTFNDWIADVGREPRADQRAAWAALNDAYLNDPTDDNFWRLYSAIDTMLVPRNATDGDHINLKKLKSAFIGQHLLRVQALGRSGFVAQSGLAFAYLESSPAISPAIDILLPNPMWDFGESGRTILQVAARGAFETQIPTNRATAQDALAALRFPDFVVNSVSPTLGWEQHGDDVRLPWFWIGWTFDPSLARADASNSTIDGEYFSISLRQARMFLHHDFVTFLRLLYRGYVPEAMTDVQRNQTENLFLPNWPIVFTGFVLDAWNEDPTTRLTADMKSRQRDLYAQLTGNAFRATLLLYEEELDRGRVRQKPDYSVVFDRMRTHFTTHHPQTAPADLALIDRVARKAAP